MIDDDTAVQVLMHHKLLSPFMLTQAQRIQKRTKDTLYQILLVHKLVDENKALSALSPYLQTPVVSLTDFIGDDDLLEEFDRETAERYQCIPLGLMTESGTEVLVLAMVDPEDKDAAEAARKLTGRTVKPVLVGPSDFSEALERCFGTGVMNELNPDGSNTKPETELEDSAAIIGHSFDVSAGDDGIPWEEVGLDAQANNYLDGILDDSDVVLLDEPVAGDGESDVVEPEQVSENESSFRTQYRKPQPSNEPSNVFKDFIRKSSVMIIPPPKPRPHRGLVVGNTTPKILESLITLLHDKGVIDADELLDTINELVNSEPKE